MSKRMNGEYGGEVRAGIDLPPFVTFVQSMVTGTGENDPNDASIPTPPIFVVCEKQILLRWLNPSAKNCTPTMDLARKVTSSVNSPIDIAAAITARRQMAAAAREGNRWAIDVLDAAPNVAGLSEPEPAVGGCENPESVTCSFYK